MSDVDGNYAINIPTDGKVVLVFAFLGYVTQEIRVGNQSTINVILLENVTEIDEVVVVGYGTQKKVTLSGAVAAIGSKEMATTKSINVQNTLTGKLAGVKVVQGTSEPGVFSENSFS
ncbi:TonB-dependent receptor SusC, partial [termite gut metagenome]